MDDEYAVYRKIQDALKGMPDNFNVFWRNRLTFCCNLNILNFPGNSGKGRVLSDIRSRKSPVISILKRPLKVKKKILTALATSAEVEDFRTIEKLSDSEPDPELKEWTILALQESRMLMQSSLLDEQQVFISTGLGGKGQKLRYFVVFLNQSGGELSAIQKKLLHDELKYALEKSEGELEELTSMIDFTTALVILPITSALRELFQGVIDECNQYGNFLQDDMVITNVKKLNPMEILDLLKQQRDAESRSESMD
jgi:hypothetical protein